MQGRKICFQGEKDSLRLPHDIGNCERGQAIPREDEIRLLFICTPLRPVSIMARIRRQTLPEAGTKMIYVRRSFLRAVFPRSAYHNLLVHPTGYCFASLTRKPS